MIPYLLHVTSSMPYRALECQQVTYHLQKLCITIFSIIFVSSNPTIMQHEDDLRGLAKVIQFMRALSILILIMHIYWYCYDWMLHLG